MRFMIIVKATKDSEAGVMPEEQLIAAMAQYHEELVKAGVLLDASGLRPSAKGWRVKFSGDKRGFGADDHEIGVDRRRQFGQDAGVVTMTGARPGDRRFPAATPDDEDPHARTPSKLSFGGASLTGIG